MSMVEGIGDEVVLFVSIASTVLLLFFTVLYYLSSERSTPRTEARSPVTTQQVERIEEETPVPEREPVSSHQEHEPENIQSSAEHVETASVPEETAEATQETEEPPLEDTEETDPAVLRQRRLDFFTKQHHADGEIVGNTHQTPNDQPPETTASEYSGNGEAVREESASGTTIRVRLKYLNDTERLVTAHLDEHIGEFKRRHFSADLESNRIVRLIFNGRVLRNDEATLESCGVGDGSVVHIQISANPTQQQPLQTDTTGELNLSSLMWPLFATMLGILWMLHFQYRELFNTTSTVVLVGISGLFCLGLFGQHYPRSGRLPNPPPR